MKISNLTESTTAGSVAPVAQPFKNVQKRPVPVAKGKGSLLKGIKSSEKYANSLHEKAMKIYKVSESFRKVEISERQIHEYYLQKYLAEGSERFPQRMISSLTHLREEKEHDEIRHFIDKIRELDLTGKIKVGDSLSVLDFEVNFAWQEITGRGFTGAKKVTKISTHSDGSINYVMFEDGSRYPRQTKAVYGPTKRPLDYSAYFKDSTSADQALTVLQLIVPDSWEFDISEIKHDSGLSTKVGEDLGAAIKRGVKSVKRGMQGWDTLHPDLLGTLDGDHSDSPRNLVKRNKGYDDATVKALSGVKGGAVPHSPSGLQKRVLDREMKKRGLSETNIDEASAPWAANWKKAALASKKAQQAPSGANHKRAAELHRHGAADPWGPHKDNHIEAAEKHEKAMKIYKVTEAGFPYDVDHMRKNTYRNGEGMSKVCPHCNGNRYVWTNSEQGKTPNHPWINPNTATLQSKEIPCPACDGGRKKVAEAEIAENDLVLAPGKGRQYKPGLLSKPEVTTNPTDTVKLDVPLLIRLLEFAKEDAADDMDLHDLAAKLVTGCQRGKTLTMRDYDQLVPQAQVSEISDTTAKSYMQGAMRDTISNKKDRNPGIKRAVARLAGTNKPIKQTNQGV